MNLDKKIEITDYVTIIALVLTLVAAVFAFYFKSKQAELLIAQRQKDLLMIAQANENAALAKKDAATANDNAALSNEKAAKSELKSKELEMELLKLRLAVSNRFLPSFIKAELTKGLKNYGPKKVMILCQISNDREPINFSNELAGFFNSIGWKAEVKNNQNVMIPSPTGIKIVVDGKDNIEIAKLVKSEFVGIGYQCETIEARNAGNLILFQVYAK